MPNIYVIIPVYNNWSMTHQRLWELYNLERINIGSILIVDDASTDETIEGIQWWLSSNLPQRPPIYHIRQSQNLGFLKNSNIGLGKVLETHPKIDDVVILLSNDVQIKAKFISQICDILSTHKALVGGKLLSYDTGWNNFGGKLYPYLEGWLLATDMGGWIDLGEGFDERFAPQDYEDVDLSTTALSLGYELLPLNNPGLIHIGGGTYGYNPKREEITKINREKFREKWTVKL